MARVDLIESLREEYKNLYQTCEIRNGRLDDVDGITDSILTNKARYEAVAGAVGVPWYFIAAIHNMESSLRFDRHLHNGDPLTGRTIHVPAGRPVHGSPPFTWEESAADAVAIRHISDVRDWSLPRFLYELEAYNGWGYRLYHSHVKSPYLWSFSTHYTSGKYVADGTWSDTATSGQCGAVLIVRRLEERGEIEPLTGEIPQRPVLYYSNTVLPQGKDLQRFLNRFSGTALQVDGKPGKKTSEAFKRIFGCYLDGDPRSNE